MDRARLEAGELGQLLLAGAEGGERLGGAGRERPAGLGEAAATAAALEQSLSGGTLEHAQVLAGRGLGDPDDARRAGDAALAVELDEQAHPIRVPGGGERGSVFGSGDGCHRNSR